MRLFFKQPFIDTLACLEPIARAGHPAKAMAPTIIGLVLTWFLYVPIHELLHVAGCVGTGGTVSRLNLSPRYGGTILEKYFDFVESGSDYAGQLTGFDTNGNDLIFLATDFGPFILTLLIGVPLLRFCATGRHPWLFGVAVVVGLAPFYNMPGDYYEMGSIIVTRVATWFSGGEGVFYEGIRSDDIFLLFETMCLDPASLGFVGAGQITLAALLIAVSMAMDLLLAFVTYWCGAAVATGVFRLDRPTLAALLPQRRRRRRR